ncbi:group I intron-associated PD-(D/E)XK endonuclease [Halospeciosus flavus]|uniref:Group I intron-associated PD-(D/E)XK endonuclease n=1 Tax=Halospeciosus flavus TaxID=3032283 RepID=A0ABD5Z5V8_9EURY|nr:group I intron-associated PD-(D/E)XK endonuclease [Halospeciosus flavus]
MSKNSKDRGDETEVRVLHELVANGHQVSIPFGDNSKYDLVVDDGDRFYRIQCKTGWVADEGVLQFNTHSQTTRDGAYHETGYEGEIDAFVVRYPEEDTLYWIPIADATSRKMRLRFDAEIDHPSINWAADYEFDGTLPGSRSKAAE